MSFDPEKVFNYQQTHTLTLSPDDCILYALSIGFSSDHMNEDHYRFTNESHSNFGPFPTNSMVICHQGDLYEGVNPIDIPGMPEFNPH